MRRILAIGPCGAGKSTLSIELARRLGLPLFHMDQLNWNAGWVETDKHALLAKVKAAAAGERWLIDGNYGGTLTPRLERADTVVYLDYPIRLCLYRLLARIRRYRGQSRPDMPDGCPERFDLAFFFYVLRWNSGPRHRTEARLCGHEDKVIRFRSPAKLQAWLDTLPTNRP